MWAYIHRANALMRLSQFDIAMSDYEAAIRANPTSADAYYSRGGANAFLGKAQLARSDYRHSAALGNQEALTRLAELEHQISGPEPSREIAGSVSPNVSAAANGRASSLEPQSAAADGNPVQVPTGATSTRPSASVATERRVALVIGNARYQNVDYLDNPGRDADAIAGALRQLGFQSVQVEKDLDLASFAAALRAFEQQADQADWALVYFAGHGIEVNGVNYLVPVDARLRSDRDIPDETITLSRVLERIENARGLRLIILDACRNNPFLQKMRRIASRSIGRGLAPLADTGAGTLVVYAARAGQEAQDGDGTNSPFVKALVTELAQPGLEIGLLFRKVRDDVLSSTGKQQEPFTYGSLPGEALYFRGR